MSMSSKFWRHNASHPYESDTEGSTISFVSTCRFSVPSSVNDLEISPFFPFPFLSNLSLPSLESPVFMLPFLSCTLFPPSVFLLFIFFSNSEEKRRQNSISNHRFKLFFFSPKYLVPGLEYCVEYRSLKSKLGVAPVLIFYYYLSSPLTFCGK